MSTREEIVLAGMRFHALIGVLPHERELPQPLEMDLRVRLTPRTSSGDVLDYRVLYDAAHAALAGGHVPYLEDVAERVLGTVLALERVVDARVEVRKPHVALAGPLAYAAVALERSRP